MRRGLSIWGVLMLIGLLVILATAAQAEKILVEPAAIASVSPTGMIGLELGFRVIPLGSDSDAAAVRRWLWVDVAGMTSNFEDWTGALGLSTEIRKGHPTRGGLIWDFRNDRALLIFTKDFSSAF